jgi:hypothetical protein
LPCVNCIFHNKGRAQAEGIQGWSAKEDIWTQGGSKNRRERSVYEEHHDWYSPDSILVIRSNIMKWRNTTHMERRNTYRVLVEKREGKRPLGRSRRIWDTVNLYQPKRPFASL